MDSDNGFDELIHAPLRLRLCGLLRPVHSLEFSVMCETLNINAPTLSKHLKLLTEAGYVRVSKTSSTTRPDSRRVSWVSLTTAGRRAFDDHVAVLREIASGAPGAD